MLIDIPLLHHQHSFVTDISTRYIGLCSGYGGGKTYAFCVKAILLASQNVGYRGALLEPTNVMVRDVLKPMMDQVLQELNIKYRYTVSPLPEYTLYFKHGKCQLLLRSAENFKRLVGLNLAFYGVDESDTLDKVTATAMWRQLQSRLRSGKVFQGFTTSTPEGFAWMHEYFVLGKDNTDRRLVKARTTDNPFLPKEYVESLRASYPANLIDAYLNGEFVNLNSNTVYQAFSRENNLTTRTIDQYPDHIIHIGVDFNIGKMAAGVAIIDKGKVYFVDEFLGARNTEDLIIQIKRRYQGRMIYIYPDSSGKNGSANSSISSIALLQQAGFSVFYHAANPRVEDRVTSVNAMFMNGNMEVRAYVNPLTCPNIVACLEQQAYRNGVPDKTAGNDHMNDAVGYLIWYRFPIIGRSRGRAF